ncbi:hypothetical protein RRF57_000623 [Xylaria bambusicola]|uniref:Uncharacterized protein n=1 Tax=Xylaria bambusicola TaxID=326684 RepID=A0AAN7Z2Q0_9PEZI
MSCGNSRRFRAFSVAVVASEKSTSEDSPWELNQADEAPSSDSYPLPAPPSLPPSRLRRGKSRTRSVHSALTNSVKSSGKP